MDPNSTDALFEIIRKELNTIIENGEKKLTATENKKQSKALKDQEKVYVATENIQNHDESQISTHAKAKQEEFSNLKSKNEITTGSLKDQGKASKAKESIPNPKSPTSAQVSLNQKSKNEAKKGAFNDQGKAGARTPTMTVKAKQKVPIKANKAKDGIFNPKTPTTGAKTKQEFSANQKIKNEANTATLEDQGKAKNAKEDIASPSTGAKSKQDGSENQKIKTEAAISDQLPRMRAGMKTSDYDILSKNEPDMQRASRLSFENNIASHSEYLSSPRTKNLDADIQKMQLELQESYTAFQSISEKFESINFNNLQKRIRDLNLSQKYEILGQNRSDELKRVVEEGFKENRLNEYTNKVGVMFSKHTGEFGDIPELSSFFQACTQLEQVLGNLKHHRNEVVHLEERMRRSAEISINRASLIKKQMEEKRFERPHRMASKDDNEDDVEFLD